MITEQQMMELVAKVNGVYLHMDNAFGGQCWDSAAWIANHFGLPVINTGGNGRWPGWAGNMVDAFPQSPEIAAAYELVAPSQRVMPGDTLVWDNSYKEWFPATHVATAVKSDSNGWVPCLSQNSSAPRPDLPGYSPEASGPTILQHLPKRGLLGIIRPRTGINYSGTTTPQEDELSAAEVASIIDAVQKMHDTTRTFTKDRVSDGKNGVIDAVQKMHDTTRIYLKDRIVETSPADLAVQINAAGIAAQVRDELVKLLAD